MNECIDAIVNNDKIPSPPSVAVRLLDLVTQPDVNVNEITKVLSADPKLSARLIDYCNSPIVGSKRAVSSLQQAVMVLGMRTLRLLSLSFSLMDTQSESDFDYDEFWRNSLANAIAAKLLGKRSGGNGDEDFLLGLLFNIGQIGIGNTYPEKLAEYECVSSLTVEMERDAFGTDRYEIGGKLLDKWNFPPSMVESVANFDPQHLSRETARMHLSQRLGGLLLSTNVVQSQILETKEQASQLLGIDGEQFDALFDELVSEWKGYEELFHYDSIAYDSIAELEARAKESMIQISLVMDTEIRQITEEKNELEASALIDVLTTLKNRTAYESEVPGVVDYHKRNGRSFGVIVIDIDHFKRINDTYGHAAGDCVLREVGKCLRSRCRKYDTVYRYGGEEFVAVVQDCDFASITAVANRFRESIEDLSIETDGQVLTVTASLGVCWAEDGECRSLEDLFNTADGHMYKAKQSGRNRCVIEKLDAQLHASTKRFNASHTRRVLDSQSSELQPRPDTARTESDCRLPHASTEISPRASSRPLQRSLPWRSG